MVRRSRPNQIVAKIGVIPHAGKRQRMQRLQGQRGESAGKHAGEIRMHAPGRTVRAKQAGIAKRVVIIDAAAFSARERTEHRVPDRHANWTKWSAGGVGEQFDGRGHD